MTQFFFMRVFFFCCTLCFCLHFCFADYSITLHYIDSFRVEEVLILLNQENEPTILWSNVYLCEGTTPFEGGYPSTACVLSQSFNPFKLWPHLMGTPLEVRKSCAGLLRMELKTFLYLDFSVVFVTSYAS